MIRKNSCENITDEEFLNIIIPFDKKMDKFGTIYISIFAQKMQPLTREAGNMKYQIADTIIKDLVNDLGPNYHFIQQPIKRRVIRAKGI